MPSDMIKQFRSLADTSLSTDQSRYSQYISTLPSDTRWLHETASGSKGTVGDRISSITLLVQGQPFLNVGMLGELIDLGGKEKVRKATTQELRAGITLVTILKKL